MTNEKAIMCLEDMKIKVPIPKAAKQARENNEALDVAIKALKNEPHWIPVTEEPKKEEKSYWVCLEDGGQCQCRWTNDVYGIGIEEIKKQYDLNIIPSTFMDKFGEYLV